MHRIDWEVVAYIVLSLIFLGMFAPLVIVMWKIVLAV